MKTGLKIIYVLIAFIVCIFAYVLSYSTNMYNYIYSITSEAISSKNYVETAMIHGGCFEKIDLVNQSDDNVNVAIFRATSLSEYSYTNDSDESVEVDKYEFAYYIYIYPGDEISISYDDSSDTTNTYNKSGIRFYNGDESYTYYFKVSDTINSSLYVESPKSYNSAILNSSRDWLEYNDNYGFINLTFQQSLLNAINETNDNKFSQITKLEILDSSGDVKRTIDITLNFKGDFFDDVESLTTAYTEYLEIYNSDATDDEKEAAEDEFTTFSESFQTEFLAKSSNYTLRHDDSYLQPSSVTWQSVGVTALFVVCAALIYFLLFHFSFIKSIFNKNSQKYDRYKTHNGSKAGAIISAKNPKPNKTEKETSKNENTETNNVEIVDDTQKNNDDNNNNISDEDKKEDKAETIDTEFTDEAKNDEDNKEENNKNDDSEA